MVNIVHFVIDDKFTLDSIKCFNDSKLSNNKYFYLLPKYKNGIKYLNNRTDIQIVTGADVMSFFQSDQNNFIVILHSLNALPASIISSIPNRYKVVWFAWGFDLYSNRYPISPLLQIENRYGEKTQSIYNRITYKRRTIDWVKHVTKLMLRSDYTPKTVYEAIYRIDYFAGVFPEEYDMLKNECPHFRAKRITHNYIHPQEFCLDDISNPINESGNNILLGNSAAFIINHIDLMKEISDCIPKLGVKIYCPLSYQGHPEYVKHVITEGKKMFPQTFTPMVDFLPFNEYSKIMDSCGCIILGQMQQAATCNILSAIWSGLKVFLPKSSMNYRHYVAEGLKVYSIEEDLTIENIMSKRTKEDILENRKRIESIYSYRRWIIDLEATINIIEQD